MPISRRAAPPVLPSVKRRWLREFGQIAAAVLALALVAGLLAVLFQGRHERNAIEQNGAVGPHHNGAIIFTSSRTGNDEIYAVEPGGIGLRQLTHDPEMDFGAIWSPDGTKIAFTRGKPVSDGPIPPATRPPISIYVMNADGSDQRNLTPGGNRSFSNLVWSPDGKQLAVECTEKPTDRDASQLLLVSSRIDVVNADGSGMRMVVSPEYNVFSAIWALDGQAIACISGVSGDSASEQSASVVRMRLDVVQFDGAPPRTLVDESVEGGSHGLFDSSPSWQPLH